MDPTLEQYLEEQLKRRKLMDSPEYQKRLSGDRRDEANSNATNAFAAAMAKAAGSFGTLGGKTPGSDLNDQLADSLAKSNRLYYGGKEQAREDAENRFLGNAKLMQYLEEKRQQKAQEAGASAFNEKKLAQDKAIADAKAAEDKRRFNTETGLKERELDLRKNEAVAKTAEKSVVPTFDSKVADLKGDQRGRFDNAVMALKAAQDMATALANGNWTISPVGDNEFTLARTQWEEAIGRMQSGGAITDEEAVRFKRMAPGILDSEEIQKKKLVEMQGIMRGRLTSMGFDPDEAIAKQRSQLDKVELPESMDGKAVAGQGKKTVVKQFKSPSTGKTKIIYSDGTEEIK